MPTPNYKNTVIYKICCKDPEITDIYVGSTTNLTNRRYCHKGKCTNPKSKVYNSKVYKYIRENGNWDNWQLVAVEEYPCENAIQSKIRERYWLEHLGATLNSEIPSRKPPEYYKANKKRIQQYNIDNFERRSKVQKKYREKHKEELTANAREKYTCGCGSTITKSNKSQHQKTKKHQAWVEEQNKK